MTRYWPLLCWTLLGVPALHAQTAIGEVFASDANVRGSVVLSGNGTRVLSGSQVSAGDGAARLKLERGGEVRICPKTNLSLSADATGKSLVLGLNAGAMEVDYSLPSASDSLLTPDFRMQLISPGTFHFAVSVAPSGDTCLRSLPGNDAAVFVAEMMGTDSYQLSPGKSVLFKAGKIARATEAPANCGCPATKAEPAANAEVDKVFLPETAQAEETASTPAAAHPTVEPPAQPATHTDPAVEPHMEVDSSFVYHGKDSGQDFYRTVARLSLSKDDSRLALALMPQVKGPQATAPAPAPPAKKPGILHRFRSFMGRLFGK